MSLLVVGSVAIDSVKTPFGEVTEVLGGSATYFSCAAHHYTDINLVGVVGDDFPGKYIDLLKAIEVDTKGLQIEKGKKTFRWKGFYDYDLNKAHTISTQLNVFETFNPHIPDEYKDSEYVFLANIDPDLQMEVLDQVKKPKLVVGDTMNFWIEQKKDSLIKLLAKLDIILLNDAEARQLTGEYSLIKAAKVILGMGPKTVIIKKGEHGALLWSSTGQHFSAPVYPLESVKDPTGAGDSFAGGFVGFLTRAEDTSDANLRRAMIYGSVMASFDVEDFSLNRLKSVTDKDITERFKDFKNITHFDET
ncbi:MAG: PfkB family carbohydrate kinase [bacterium]